MNGGREKEIVKIAQIAGHTPTPYGCISLVVLILATFTTVALSALAIGIAISQ